MSHNVSAVGEVLATV